MRFKRFVNILLLITFFSWVVHVTFNSCSTLQKKPWGSVGLSGAHRAIPWQSNMSQRLIYPHLTCLLDCASSKGYGNVFSFAKSLNFQGEIKNKRPYNLTRLVT